LEVVLYICVGVLLAAAAAFAAFEAGAFLWQTVAHETLRNYGIVVLDRLLLVLMLVEILHTVRISIGSK
jgi:hypothetical protein